MNLPKVSIQITAYNQRDYIREAVESALAQDYPNLEVVISDDASTDGTAEIIAEYQRNHPGQVIAVLGEKNVGITGNSNRGFYACSGELLAFMGGDDVLLPGKISAQVAWFAEDPQRALCGHQVEVFYHDGSRPPHPLSRHMHGGRGAESLIRYGPYGATSVMIRRDRAPPYGFDEALPIISDQMLWIDVVRSDGIIGWVPGTFARYRRHSSNITNEPLAYLDEVGRFLARVSERYPEFEDAARYATTRRLLYDPAVFLLKRGEYREARAMLWKAIHRENAFIKAWVRIAQSLAGDWLRFR